MPYATPTRAAHRSTAGQHRATAARSLRVPKRPQRGPQILIKALAGSIVAALVGVTGFLAMADERRGHPAEASTPARAKPDLLADRVADPAPLSLQEVFPNPEEVRPPGGATPYQLTMTHIDNDCEEATIGAVGPLLRKHGCDQVVRAALTAPYGGYRVTAGLFNLTDAGGADEVDGRVRRLVETGDGSFAAMTAGLLRADGSAPPSTPVGWHARGHYLLYCVITGPNGESLPGDDAYAPRITSDLIDGYLAESVLGPRASRA